jgi:hypothetical protein
MVLSKAESDILSFLFSKYKEDANEYYNIGPFIKEAGLNATDVLEKFRQKEYLKPDVFISEGGNFIKCSIAAKGILVIDAPYLEEKIHATLKGLGDIGGFGNVMKILGYDRDQHQRGFDLANEMQNRDYIKLLYASYTQNVISVEMLLPGKYIYDKL